MRVGNISRSQALAGILLALLAVFASSRLTGSAPSRSSARLISIEQLPDRGEACYRSESSEGRDESLFAAFEETSVYAADTLDLTRPAARTIKDTYPIYSSIAVDPVRDEVVLQDTNLFGIKVFNRLDNTPPNVESTTPKRVIQGAQTHCEYNNGLTIDSRNGDVYSVAMDTEDNVLVFSHESGGDVPQGGRVPEGRFRRGKAASGTRGSAHSAPRHTRSGARSEAEADDCR